MQSLSPLRSRLASFEHAYALATQLRRATGRDQFVIWTCDPLQPVRVTAAPPEDGAVVLALIL